MKKQVLSFALLLFFMTQTKGQTSVYHPFPDSNAVWNESNACIGEDSGEGVTLDSKFIKGDTTIGVNVYNKLCETGIMYYSYDNSNDSVINTSSYFVNIYSGAIRQDTAQKKVYIIQPGSSSDTLLYDFNLAVGDTLPASDISYNNYNYVSEVDSILIGNDYRKRFWLSVSPPYPGSKDTNCVVAIIEGIGSTLGLDIPLNYCSDPLCSYGLLCFNQNGQTFWPDSSTSCNIETVVNEIKQDYFISLYPNPATNQLTIHTTSFHNEAVMVSVLNVLGQNASPPTSLTPTLSKGEGDATIYIGDLSAGIYFLQMKSESGSVVKMFVKE